MGGVDTDTFFTSDELAAFLINNNGDVHRAAYFGWLAKEAEYASLVNVSEGNALRQMSDLYKAAQGQVKYYERLNSTANHGRTRVGRIRRRY